MNIWCRRQLGVFVVLLSVAALAIPLAAGAKSPNESDRLVVHEWGTFTCLQDELGRALPGINTDDEPLPGFVHRLSEELVFDPSDLAPVYYKGVPRIHPWVTMRLETPVVYFYPPAGTKEPTNLDLSVGFKGGWLTEYYPAAEVAAPGLAERKFRFGELGQETLGSLAWNGLTLGGNPDLPETDYNVWLAPRKTQSAAVQTIDGEGERYLFYRGVGKIDAPLRVTRDAEANRLTVAERFDTSIFDKRTGSAPATRLWLVHVREDGAVAYRDLGRRQLSLNHEAPLLATPATFDAGSFALENLAELRGEMHFALVEDGLFPDEATAMLATWELGYFRAPGERLFFMLPKAWTAQVLPLTLSVPADVERTMVGRIELVSPAHREALAKVAKNEDPSLTWLYEARESQESLNAGQFQELWEGKSRLLDVVEKVPEEYQAYVELGRFRNALVLDEIARNENSKLRPFAEVYRLEYYDTNR
ncbi:MAG TPA: hypothetical protein VGN57_20460 [Pirellulaceae bacterium]|nr:hypothetical protein [Pirellulaceae bacterium]